MKQQLSLGGFVFNQADDFAYDKLERKAGGGWKKIEVLDAKPRAQNMGQDAESLRISGRAFYATGMRKMDELRDLQSQREPLTIVDGAGSNWGRWTLDSVNESQSRVIDDGTAMVVAFTLELTEFDE